jgi:hypothetical protein
MLTLPKITTKWYYISGFLFILLHVQILYLIKINPLKYPLLCNSVNN